MELFTGFWQIKIPAKNNNGFAPHPKPLIISSAKQSKGDK
jgi:hypothetical protein